jgi:hypothetical protein
MRDDAANEAAEGKTAPARRPPAAARAMRRERRGADAGPTWSTNCAAGCSHLAADGVTEPGERENARAGLGNRLTLPAEK